jgi:malate dehydrogenase (oxaloacetate-decarboxylating)
MPIVYTPTVGLACQEFSHILRRTRGTWITPADRDRIPEILRNGPFEDVRLIVVTDNERILGLGDLGAGGMAIPIGKLALYTAACGIYPALTLPVSLDVGTDTPALLDDPLYIGHRAPRLRGAEYDALVDAFVDGVQEVWPGCVIQWEDFKHHNALRILDRYRDRVPSFNDDVQGTAAVVTGGLMAALRHVGRSWDAERIMLVGAGAAGIGIARLLRTAMLESGLSPAAVTERLLLVDSHGLVHAGRTDLDPAKTEFAGSPHPDVSDLADAVRELAPTILIGTTGTPGTFDERVVRAMAATCERPIVMPLSNPTAMAEARPEDVVRWSDGRALVATGSPFAAVDHGGIRHEVGQANNVYVFPGIGLGTMVSEASAVSDGMVLAAARALADRVSSERLDAGALYPPIGHLRDVSRHVGLAVAREAMRAGLAVERDDAELEAELDAAMWWPSYVPYRPA